jgi:parallel beta-helix repeat protein
MAGRTWLGVGGSVALLMVAQAWLPPSASASTHAVIHVPGDQPTIQAGIDAAVTGDVVAVDPGVYFENLDFNGKAITVTSTRGAKVTVVDGGWAAPVVTMDSGERPTSVLQGFTLRHGNSDSENGSVGGGIYVTSSPVIIDNVITNNVACGEGGGIGIMNGSPLIARNQILWNHQYGCSGGYGGGISINGTSGASIVHNTIAHNSWGSSGGGIGMNDAGGVLIANNVIRENNGSGAGGGIWMVNSSEPTIVQNLVVGNTAGQGGGIYWSIPFGIQGPLLVNNTIADNQAITGSGIWGGGFQDQVEAYNNVVVGISGKPAIYCDDAYAPNPPQLRYNDAWSADTPGFDGTCAGENGSEGNISVDPIFVGPADYHLQTESPCVDAGDNTAPSLPATDIDRDPRIVGVSVDQGFDEVAW